MSSNIELDLVKLSPPKRLESSIKFKVSYGCDGSKEKLRINLNNVKFLKSRCSDGLWTLKIGLGKKHLNLMTQIQDKLLSCMQDLAPTCLDTIDDADIVDEMFNRIVHVDKSGPYLKVKSFESLCEKSASLQTIQQEPEGKLYSLQLCILYVKFNKQNFTTYCEVSDVVEEKEKTIENVGCGFVLDEDEQDDCLPDDEVLHDMINEMHESVLARLAALDDLIASYKSTKQELETRLDDLFTTPTFDKIELLRNFLEGIETPGGIGWMYSTNKIYPVIINLPLDG